MFEYAVKLICGLHRDPRDRRLMRGAYATTINVHNPNEFEVEFRKKLALTFPPQEQRGGEVFDRIGDGPHVLGPDQALSVDCMDIQRQVFPGGFPPVVPGGPPAAYIEGFVVIQCRESLDVTAVYTSAAVDAQGQLAGHSGIDVEQIHERQKEG